MGYHLERDAVRALGEVNQSVLAKINLTPNETSFFISHQANKRILQAMAKQLKVMEKKVLVNV